MARRGGVAMASQIATKKSKRNPPEICGDAFVVVTVEEIELSLSSVVALPSDDEDEGSDAVLEARVLATQQVAAETGRALGKVRGHEHWQPRAPERRGR